MDKTNSNENENEKNNNKNERSGMRNRLLGLTYTALFTAVIAVCSQIQIPLGPVPFTLQTLGICIAAGILGLKRGFLSVLVYVILGTVGVPVFAGFSGGVGCITGPTGGYITGFLFTGLAVGLFADLFGKKVWSLTVGMVVGILICYVFGTAWFVIVSGQNGNAMDIMTALGYCVFPFLLPDAAKIIASVILVNRIDAVVKPKVS